jgi:hypothetical protein
MKTEITTPAPRVGSDALLSLDDFLRGVVHEEIDRDFSVDVMPMESRGKKARNTGGVRLVFAPERDWPSFSLARLGCKRTIYRLRSTPEMEAFRANSWRARSLIYAEPRKLAADLATFGVSPRRIANIIDECAGYWLNAKVSQEAGEKDL